MAFRRGIVWVTCRICHGDEEIDRPLIYDFARDDGSWVHPYCLGKEMANESFKKIKLDLGA